MRAFRERVRLAIEKARVSQAEVARVAGMNAAHLNDILRGRRKNISAEVVVRIARALGCSSDWLLGLPSEAPTPAGIRHAVAIAGGRMLERIGSERMDPVNINAGVNSRRGRVRCPPRVREDLDDA